MSELIEFSNHKRFIPSATRCPQCGGDTLEDHWPPNYWGGSTTFNMETHTVVSKDQATVKHVCTNCKIAFKVFIERINQNDSNKETRTIGQIVPLVERDGMLLTPHDAWRQKHYDEHGEWPIDAWM